jgi:hypothetical protein
MSLGFHRGGLSGRFSLARGIVSRPIRSDGQEGRAAYSKRVVGCVRLGHRSSSAERMPHRGATHAKQAVGYVRLRAKLVFFVIFYAEHSFN